MTGARRFLRARRFWSTAPIIPAGRGHLAIDSRVVSDGWKTARRGLAEALVRFIATDDRIAGKWWCTFGGVCSRAGLPPVLLVLCLPDELPRGLDS